MEIKLNDLSANTRASGSFSWTNGVTIVVNWSTAPNVSGGYTAVTVSMSINNVSIAGNAGSGSHLTINGGKYDFSGRSYNHQSVVSSVTLASNTVHVYHSAAKTININGNFVWYGTIWVNGSIYVSTISGSNDITLSELTPPLTPPGNTGAMSLSGNYENGSKVIVSWGASPGTVQHYSIEYKKLYTDGWTTWYGLGTSTTNSYTHNISNLDALGVTYRVRAYNAAGYSGYTEGAVAYHYGIKVWNGSDWVWGKLQVWDGSKWVQGVTRKWTGSGWKYGT